MRCAILGWVVLCAIGYGWAAAQEAKPENPPPTTMTRVYNIGDLIHMPSDNPLKTAMRMPSQVDKQDHSSGMMGRDDKAADTDDDVEQETDNLLQLIQDTVAPDTWRDKGGEIGSIRAFRNQMVVTQTEAGHRAIADLLKEMRKSARPVHMRAEWRYLTPEQLDGLWEKGQKAGGLVDRAAVAKLDKNTLWARAELDCTDGQMVHITGGRVRNHVENVSPVVGGEVAAFSPQITLLQAGVALQVRPRIGDGNSATLDVLALVGDTPEKADPIVIVGSNRTEPSTQPGSNQGRTTNTATVTVDRLNVGVQQFATTARVPVGKPVLIGGVTLDPTRDGDGRQLYLIIETLAGE